MNRHCTHCGAAATWPGLLKDHGEPMPLALQWIAGPIVLGKVKGRGKHAQRVRAFRCAACGHIDLFAGDAPPLLPTAENESGATP